MKYDCIMLAAGLSSRMGQWKPAMEIEGKAMICHSIEKASDETARIIVAGGYRFEDLKVILKDIDGLKIIENRNFEQGMLTSVKAALPYIHSERFFITLADMPYIQERTYEIMSRCDFDEVLFPCYEGRRGHPVLVDSKLAEEILNAPDSFRMRDILSKKKITEIEIDDPGIVHDVDMPEDIERNREKS